MLTEKELVSRAKQGDDSAFAELVEQNQGRIYNLTLRMTGNPEDAADLTQETFLNAWRALPEFQGNSSLATWLYRLASNASIDFIRREKRHREAAPTVPLEFSGGEGDESRTIELPDYRYSPEVSIERQELRSAIEQGLATLSEQHRTVLVLREIEGLSYGEIAAALQLEEGTVKSRISRARIELRKLLMQYGNFLPSVSSKGQKEFTLETKGGEHYA